MSAASVSSPGRAARATATAWPVPRCGSCTTLSVPGGRTCRTAAASWPSTTSVRCAPASAVATSTWAIMGQPARLCRALGHAERMRVPLPAARMMAVTVMGVSLLNDADRAQQHLELRQQRLDRLRRPVEREHQHAGPRTAERHMFGNMKVWTSAWPGAGPSLHEQAVPLQVARALLA